MIEGCAFNDAKSIVLEVQNADILPSLGWM